MDKYQRVEKPRRDDHATQVEPNEIRITQQGKVRSYISYGHGLLTEKNERCIVLKAMGNAISKAVTVAEILKHRVANLHMVTRISSIETVDVYDPLEEGLDRIETKRKIPSISIHLSLDALDRDEPGYQSPIPADQVSTGSPSYANSREYRKARGQSRRSGRSGGRGSGRGRGGGGGGDDVGDGEADATVGETAETQEKVEQETGGDDAAATSTPTTRGKRGKGQGWGRSGSNGGRGRKSGDQSPTNEGDGHAESSSAVENEAVASTPTGRKPGRGRKGKKTSSSGDQEKQNGDGEGDDETGENAHANHRGGRGRHSGRGRNRGRGRGRGLSESTRCDGNDGSLDTADVNTAPDDPPASE